MGSEAYVLSIRVKHGEILLKKYLFFVTFHPKLTSLAKKIKELSKYLHLDLDLEIKAVFTPTPMVSFCSARKIKD